MCKILGKRSVFSQPWGDSNNPPPLSPSRSHSGSFSIKGWGIMQWDTWGQSSVAEPGGESPLSSCHPPVMKQSWRAMLGEGTGQSLGLLIRRNMGPSASREQWLLGMSVLNWDDKGAQNWEASTKQQHLHQLRLICTGQMGGETSPSDPQSFLTSGLGHTGERCSPWSGQP